MDKGKKPIQEEEDFLSLVNDYHTNNMILSATPLAPPEFNIFSHISELELVAAGTLPKETTASLVDEMDQGDKEDFFTKFLGMFVEFPDPSTEQYSMLTESNSPGVLPIAQADDGDMADLVLPLSDKLTSKPPKPLPAPPADDKDKPLVFRKTMRPHELAEVAICDPKRAKRIVTNRMSAIRAKEKKKLYVCMLEHKTHTLQSKSANLTARLTLLETEGASLNAENTILKDRMQIMLQQIHLQDLLNDQIRSEIQHMKTVLGQNIPNLGALIELYGNSSNQDINAPLDTTQQLPEIQLQNPSPEQQAQLDFQQQQQQPYLGLQNFGVPDQYGQGEFSQPPQQIYQENPLPYDHYQMQNEPPQAHQLQQAQPQLPEFEQLHAGSFNIGSENRHE